MSRISTHVFILAALAAALPCTGCTGQSSAPPAPVAEQAPPPMEPATTTAAAKPPTPPAAPQSSTTNERAGSKQARHVPEERTTKRVAPAPVVPSTITLTIPAGTTLSLSLVKELTSEHAAVGDTVAATLKQPIIVEDRVAFPAGSEVRGTVSDVKSASKGFKETGGALSIQFQSIVGPDGRQASIAAGFTKVAEGSAAKKGAIIGGSAVGGALLGKAMHKSTGGGAVVGAAIGTAVAGTTKGREAAIKVEDAMQVALEQSAKVTLKR